MYSDIEVARQYPFSNSSAARCNGFLYLSPTYMYQAINARAESLKAQGELRSTRDIDKEEAEELKRLKAKASQDKAKFEREIDKLKQRHEEQVSDNVTYSLDRTTF